VSSGEEAFVAWLRRRLPEPVLVGDDVAALDSPRGQLIVTVDQQIEGTHFAPGLDPGLVGRRLVRVNLSDLAAAGAHPRWALLTLAIPPELDPRAVVEGVIAECRHFGLALAGGDVAHAPLLAATLTALGDRPRRAPSLGRDRARTGHRIWIGGTVGESALGCELLLRGATMAGRRVALPDPSEDLVLDRLMAAAAKRAVRRNVLPEPQLGLGAWLAELAPRRAGACIDVSDGLAKDLRRIATASGRGVELDLRLVKRATSPRFEALATALGLDPIAVALAGGEDYVLLFTLPSGVEPPAALGARPIGRVVASRESVMLDRDGRGQPLPELGWDHLS